MDDAGRAALEANNQKSKDENIEYAGLIYRDIKTKKYHFTDSKPGTDHDSQPYDATIPAGTVAVGEYHTHGDYSIRRNGKAVRTSDPKRDDYNSDNFSGGDKTGAMERSREAPKGYKMYLGTPSGVFRVYDTTQPRGQRDKVL